jgi:hypothetical protein
MRQNAKPRLNPIVIRHRTNFAPSGIHNWAS